MFQQCPTPMYFQNDIYLGTYRNNTTSSDSLIESESNNINFGLDEYECTFLLDFQTWRQSGRFHVTLKFDIDDYNQDIFYFCHVSTTIMCFITMLLNKC